ncbi:Hypothetical protein R9X50_00761100 [Acrodontium crateriforme]|uniref:Uncharacterized protein n=1 Tax=Acrodontium crateriforme TaxID=150365 RepID=A0AAQ3MCK0_9PEZI|nr:Hypothetical protein R9X50_00761100 [Acrodontium crateriforme]
MPRTSFPTSFRWTHRRRREISGWNFPDGSPQLKEIRFGLSTRINRRVTATVNRDFLPWTSPDNNQDRQTFKMAPPTYLYKLMDTAPPSPMPETLSLSDLDKHDGFIHLSNAEMAPKTSSMFLGHCNKLWILKLQRSALDGRIEYSTDPKAGVVDGCAHLHESKTGLGSGNVESVIEMEKTSEQDWTEVAEWSKL